MNEILEFIYKSKLILNSAKKITGNNDLYEDLISELILIISDTKKEFIEELYARNELELYCYKIMYYQYTNPSREFYKKYRTFESQVGEVQNEETNIDELYKNVVEIISKIEKRIAQKRFPSEIRLLELYVKHDTFRSVSKEVGIANGTVHYMISKIVKQIKKEYDISHNS